MRARLCLYVRCVCPHARARACVCWFSRMFAFCWAVSLSQSCLAGLTRVSLSRSESVLYGRLLCGGRSCRTAFDQCLIDPFNRRFDRQSIGAGVEQGGNLSFYKDKLFVTRVE